MHVDAYEFGRITIDGVAYDRDVVVDHGKIRKRKKGPSKPRKGEFGHTRRSPRPRRSRGRRSGSGSGPAPTGGFRSPPTFAMKRAAGVSSC